MLGTFAILGKHVKVKPSQVNIDNIVFKMHYRGTFCILIIATILVCSREYIGEHIRCIVDSGIPPHVINTFCFFTSTFTVVQHYNETMLEKGYIPHPGVGPSIDEDPVTHHAYYQWVPFFLFGQAILFYLPHYIWKKKEGGRIQALVDGLQVASMAFADQDISVNGIVVPSKETVQEKMVAIKTDFLTRLHATRTWSTWLIFCEVLNLVNVILQVHFTNKFLGGHFLSLGHKVAQHDDWDRKMDPLDVVFPKVTKCQFHKFGPSGSIQKHDALCVMALNVINEKIYTFLWFWFLFLFIISILGLLWRLLTFLLHSRSAKFSEYVFSTANPGRLDIQNVACVTRECFFADWLFLYYLAKNMDGFVFRQLFINLAEEMANTPLGLDGTRSPIYSDGDTSMDGKERFKRKGSSSPSSLYDEGTLKLLSDDDADQTLEKKKYPID